MDLQTNVLRCQALAEDGRYPEALSILDALLADSALADTDRRYVQALAEVLRAAGEGVS